MFWNKYGSKLSEEVMYNDVQILFTDISSNFIVAPNIWYLHLQSKLCQTMFSLSITNGPQSNLIPSETIIDVYLDLKYTQRILWMVICR